MPYCNDCGSQVSDTARFCTECGTKLIAGVSAGHKVNVGTSCPSCGSSDKVRWSVINTSWVCDNCGHSFIPSGGSAPQKHESNEQGIYSRVTAAMSVGHKVNVGEYCQSCGNVEKVRWSVMNKSWICDACGHSWGMLGSG